MYLYCPYLAMMRNYQKIQSRQKHIRHTVCTVVTQSKIPKRRYQYRPSATCGLVARTKALTDKPLVT